MEKWKEESQQNNNFRSHMSLGKKKKVPDLSLCGPAHMRGIQLSRAAAPLTHAVIT